MRRKIVSKGLGAGVVLVALACIVLAAVELYQAFWNAPQLKRDRESVSHAFEVMSTARELEWAVRDAERGQRNYLITGDASHLSAYRSGMQAAPALHSKLKQLTADNPEQQGRLPVLDRDIQAKLAQLRRTAEIRETRGADAAFEMIRAALGADTMGAISRTVDGIVEAEDTLLKARQARAAETERTAARTALVAALLALAVMAAGALLLAQAFVRARRSERALRASEDQFRVLVGGVTDYAIYMLDPQGRVTSWNAGAKRIKGYEADEIVGQDFSRFYIEEERKAGLPEQALETAAREGRYEAEAWRVRKDGSRFWASVVIDALRDDEGKLIGFGKVTRDITERRQREEELERVRQNLVQAQKMEALGQLTGGIAHDFNNMLTVIKTAIDTLQRRLSAGERDVARYVEAVIRSADRAASVTQRLLAFARRQPLEPKALDANKLVAGATEMLRRSLPETIALETALAGGLWWTQVDPNQLESAILNLALNARDAMPAGGKLTIETANAFLDETYAGAHAEVAPGQYVMIALSDSGTGMPKDVAARAFEPFFTTKDEGQGTGLGLSQVFGFIKQSRGHVKLYSEAGEGTTVKIYLPRLDSAPLAEAAVEVKPKTMKEAKETILLVEDDEDVRGFIGDSLRELGYEVFAAGDGPAALRVLDERPEVDLLFTDVGLPNGMNGRVLAEEARLRRRQLKVLFTTGYARNAIIHHGRLDAGVDLIAKPYTQTELAAKVRKVLDR
ncbi:MAG TPA: CHASE3 domain-containing protein [Burkholderiales bacterium]|nr:CHASE3 domain-containing protein [Burkholderiales bacterium]